MAALPRPSFAFRLRPVLLALFFAVVVAASDARAVVYHPGQWSATFFRHHIQIHMALVRGGIGDTYHSRILTWEGKNKDGTEGEEIGWQPGLDGCGANSWNSFTFDGLGIWKPGARIFCDGHTHLANGKLLSAGGDDEVNERGIHDARTYQAGAGSQAGTWTKPVSTANRMRFDRFYPTLTTLSDGRAIAVGGNPGSGAALADATGSETAPGSLVSETQPLAEGAWRVSLRLMTEAESATTGSAITVDKEESSGARVTLGQFAPKASEDVLGLAALREKGRVAIPAHYRLEQVMPRFRHRGADLELADAVHSRLGSLGAEFVAHGGGIELLAGDVVELTYAPSAKPLEDVSSWYLLVRRQETAPDMASSNQATPAKELPARFALYPSEPNPTAGLTRIRFDLPQETPVKLELFDMLGRRVATMADGLYPAGSHAVAWNLRDSHGATVRPGVYLSRMSAGTFRARGKVTVLP